MSLAIRSLELIDTRSYERVSVEFADGVTVLQGDNGEGKTNLLEAVHVLGNLTSFRTSSSDALVRMGQERAVMRGVFDASGREITVEAEFNVTGRRRVLLNRQRVTQRRDLLDVIRLTVFTPDDLELVKGSPGQRRSFLDDVVAARRPADDQLRAELEKTLRQRGALLKQAKGRLTDEVALTLDVWDQRVAAVGERVGAARHEVVDELAPIVDEAYREVAVGRSAEVTLVYNPPWRDVGLAEALAEARVADVRRGVTTVGPHRDDVDIVLNGRPARTHASQGEQRSIALALRLASHRLLTARWNEAPILLLDDVFSELDPGRGAALVSALPPGQTILTTATPLPDHVSADLVLGVSGGSVTPLG